MKSVLYFGSDNLGGKTPDSAVSAAGSSRVATQTGIKRNISSFTVYISLFCVMLNEMFVSIFFFRHIHHEVDYLTRNMQARHIYLPQLALWTGKLMFTLSIPIPNSRASSNKHRFVSMTKMH